MCYIYICSIYSSSFWMQAIEPSACVIQVTTYGASNPASNVFTLALCALWDVSGFFSLCSRHQRVPICSHLGDIQTSTWNHKVFNPSKETIVGAHFPSLPGRVLHVFQDHFASQIPMCQLMTSLPAAFNAADLLITLAAQVAAWWLVSSTTLADSHHPWSEMLPIFFHVKGDMGVSMGVPQ